MFIRWHKNPIRTQIFLTPQEKEILRLKVIAETVKESAHTALFYLNWEKFSPEERAIRAIRHLECAEDMKHCQECFEEYVQELENGVHCGDCTCVAATCSKCMAEDLVGVNTMPGMAKHSAYKIDAAFGPDGSRSINEAIEHLQNYNPVRTGAWLNYTEEEFQQHVPAWKKQADIACGWLIRYRDETYLPSLLERGGLNDIADLASRLGDSAG